MAQEVNFARATRRLLFGKQARETAAAVAVDEYPGAGRSPAEEPARHIRLKVTMNVDGDIVAYFKERAKEQGRPYQLLINEALRECIEGAKPERVARRVGNILLEDESFLERLSELVNRARP